MFFLCQISGALFTSGQDLGSIRNGALLLSILHRCSRRPTERLENIYFFIVVFYVAGTNDESSGTDLLLYRWYVLDLAHVT